MNDDARLRSCIDEITAALSPLLGRGTALRFGTVTAHNGGTPPTIDVDGRPMRYLDTGLGAPTLGEPVVWFQDEPSAVALAVIGDQFVCVLPSTDDTHRWWATSRAGSSKGFHIASDGLSGIAWQSGSGPTSGFLFAGHAMALDLSAPPAAGTDPDPSYQTPLVTYEGVPNPNPIRGTFRVAQYGAVITDAGEVWAPTVDEQNGFAPTDSLNIDGVEVGPLTGIIRGRPFYDYVNDRVLLVDHGSTPEKVVEVSNTGAVTLLTDLVGFVGNLSYRLDFAPDGTFWVVDLDGSDWIMSHHETGGALIDTWSSTFGEPRIWHISADSGTVFMGSTANPREKLDVATMSGTSMQCTAADSAMGSAQQRVPNADNSNSTMWGRALSDLGTTGSDAGDGMGAYAPSTLPGFDGHWEQWELYKRTHDAASWR